MALYHPPKNLTRTLLQIVTDLDPTWRERGVREPQYEMSNGRKFEIKPGDRHPYDIED